MYAHGPIMPPLTGRIPNEAGRNRVMASLPSDVLDRVWQDAIQVRLMHGQVLARAGESVRQVMFVVHGLVCLVPGHATQGPNLAMIGRDGGVGLMESYMGRSTMFAAAVVQIGGLALAIQSDQLRELSSGADHFSAAALKAVHELTSQLMENSASNACDTVIQRCARWLLMAHDRLGAGDVLITHSALADLLGVRRSGVTVAMSALLERGLVESRRGRICLKDPESLRLLGSRTIRPAPKSVNCND